jgi:hypothetical protein
MTKRYNFKNFACVNRLTLVQVARVTASYLVLDSPKGSGSGNIAKNVFLVPVQSFARVIGDSFYARLEQAIPTTAGDYAVDDVGSLTASQLNDVLETGTIILTPRPYDDFICKWLGNFIKPDLY